MTARSFRVLGPVEVWSDGRPVPRQTPRHRAVLAALLVDAGTTVPLDVLVDRVWNGQPPTAVLGTLQAVISKLRRELEPDVQGGRWELLVTRDPGYRLEVEPEDVDALRFQALLRTARGCAERGDTEAAREAVGDALALWRGPAYADVAETFAVEEAARLEQLRLDARELAADLDLRLGRHAELVEDLRALVRAEPLREGLRGSLMLALYRAGRQAEALQVYDEGRRLLSDELGVDPGRGLQALHERILRQDPGLTAPAVEVRVPAPRPEPAPAPPPARVAEALPAPLTAFVGRTRELDVLAATVAAQRLATLVGPGGSGKTRLALEGARRHAPVGLTPALVELAGVDDPALVATQVATALGVTLAAADAVSALVPALQTRPTLLVLDNCEHVVDAAAELTATLLARCPDLRVLATSRQPLGLPGEAVLPCGPMPAGDLDSDAVRLFLDRARLAAPHLADPTAEELALIGTICAELDGLPLAVELAAACLTTLPLAEVAARVDDRFSLLAGGWRTAPPHQRTLAATLQWSVDLLDARQLEVFRAVSVFSGSFAADAVEAVAGTGRPRSTLEPLRALAAQSLVEVDHRSARYRMLETLRQYADQLLDDDERRALRDRHAAFAADLAEGIEPTLRRGDGARGWARLDAEQQNLRTAMAHALATGQGTVALRIAGSLGWWWYRRGYVAEGRQWLAESLAAAPDAPAGVRMQALLGDALLAYLTGDVPAIWARTNEIIEIAPETEGLLALALVLRGFVRALLGHVDKENETARDVARGMAVAEVCGIDWVRSEIAMTLGQFSRADGNPDAALEHLDRAEELARQFGHSWAECSALWVRTKVLIETGRGQEAADAIARSVAMAFADGDRTSTLAGLLTAAGAATAAGDPRTAAVLLGAIETLSRRVGYDPLRMDPVDGRNYVDRTSAGLDPAEEAAARAEGRTLDMPAAVAVVAGLAGANAPAPATRSAAAS